VQWRHNAAHHAPAHNLTEDEKQRVAGRVHALVRRRSPRNFVGAIVRLTDTLYAGDDAPRRSITRRRFGFGSAQFSACLPTSH
jgi:hypothetical protein